MTDPRDPLETMVDVVATGQKSTGMLVESIKLLTESVRNLDRAVNSLHTRVSELEAAPKRRWGR